VTSTFFNFGVKAPSGAAVAFFGKALVNQVFNENRVMVMLKSAAAGLRTSTFGFRSITLVCLGLGQTCCMGSLYQKAAWDCYPGVCDQGQGHCF